MADAKTEKAAEAPVMAPAPARRPILDPTVSADDLKLYEYTEKNAPEDVVINVGTGPLLVTAPNAVNDPHRMEIGDRRRGAYYIGLLGKMPGLMQLRHVDAKRLDAVNKIRDIRIGKREDDWIVAARKKSAEAGGSQPLPFNPHADISPLARAAQGV